jgi:hypothetical protein
VLDTLDTLCDQSLAPGWTEIALFRHCHVALFFVDRNSLCVVVSSVHSTHISSRRLHSIHNNTTTTPNHRIVSWTTLGTHTSIHITRHPSPHHRHITSNLPLGPISPSVHPQAISNNRTSPAMHPGVLHRRFLNDLSSSLFSFVLPLLPTSEELHIKEECVWPILSPRWGSRWG